MCFSKLKSLHYKKLFIYGAFTTIIILTLIGTVVDAYRGSVDAYFDFLYALFSFIAFKLTMRNEVDRGGIALFWISAISEFIFIFINGADFDLIFAILIPIIAFISMKLRQIIINLTIFYTILIAILIYFYINYPNHFILHNTKYLLAYIYAHLFMVAYGFFYYFAIDESVKRLENLNRQNTLLLQEVHHRVKNNLNIISSILGLQSFKIEDKSAKDAILGSRQRIESMATLHELLYKNRATQNISIKIFTQKLVNNIIKSESTKDSIDINLNIIDINVSISTLIQYGIMINELVTNSLKYANKGNKRCKIDINFFKENNYYILNYCDNAKFIDLKKMENGFGFNLIKLSIKYFNGKYTIDTNSGLCYKIVLNEI